MGQVVIEIVDSMDMGTKEWANHFEVKAHGVRVVSDERYQCRDVAFDKAKEWCVRHGIEIDNVERVNFMNV